MSIFSKRTLMVLLLAGAAGKAMAADLPEPPVVEAPPAPVAAEASPFGGWYLRGDVDYHWADFRGADYYTYRYDPKSESIKGYKDGRLHGDLDETGSIGGGVGYQINDYLRADVTADWMGKVDFDGHTEGFCNGSPCKSHDKSDLETWLLLANAYADLGTYYGFTPYVGAGIGGAHVSWDDLKNTIGHETTRHHGNEEWRFAYAFMAGTSYCLSKNLDLDVGYRFSRINGGEMFGFENGGGPGYDKGVNVHEVRAGLRYTFGGGRPSCGAPTPVAYEPPVYK